MNPNITFSVEEFGTGGMNSGKDRLSKFYSPTQYEYKTDAEGNTVFAGPRKKVHDVNSQRNYRNKNRDKLRQDAKDYYKTMSAGQKANWKKQMALINKNHRLNKKLSLLDIPIKDSGDNSLKKQLERRLNKDWLALADSLSKQGIQGYSKAGRKSKKYNDEKKLFFSSGANIKKAEDAIKDKMRADIEKGKKEIEEERAGLVKSGVIKQKKDKDLVSELQYKIDESGDRVGIKDNAVIPYLEPEYEEVALAPKGTTNTSLNLKGLQVYYDNFLKPNISEAEKKQLLKSSKKKIYKGDLESKYKEALAKAQAEPQGSPERERLAKIAAKLNRQLNSKTVSNPFIPQ